MWGAGGQTSSVEWAFAQGVEGGAGCTLGGERKRDAGVGVGRPASDVYGRMLNPRQVTGFGVDRVAERAVARFDAFLRGCAADGQRSGVALSQLGEQPPQGEQGDEGEGGDDRGPPPPALAAPAGPVVGAEQDVVRGGQRPADGRHQIVLPVDVEPGEEDQRSSCAGYFGSVTAVIASPALVNVDRGSASRCACRVCRRRGRRHAGGPWFL